MILVFFDNDTLEVITFRKIQKSWAVLAHLECLNDLQTFFEVWFFKDLHDLFFKFGP